MFSKQIKFNCFFGSATYLFPKKNYPNYFDNVFEVSIGHNNNNNYPFLSYPIYLSINPLSFS